MREKGNPRGENTGFACLDEFYSVKQGSYTFILAPPYHGKSEFAFEIAFAQAENMVKKH
jgi:replicative DNA helicase